MNYSSQATPVGFKQTDIGMVPSDWSIDRVDKHAAIKTGSKNTQDNVKDGKYPFYVRSQIVERINSYSFDGEAVLTAGDGVGTGKVFHYINGKFDVHQRVYRMSNFSKLLDGRYFYFQFSTRFYNRIMSMTAKSSVDSVRREMIAGMEIPLPGIKEQIQIANTLIDIDDLIQRIVKLIAKKKAIKQGAMQDLLTGKRRLPGFSGEWEEKKVGDVTLFHKQGYYTQESYKSEGEYFLLRGTDMQNPRIDLSTTPKINANAKDFHDYMVMPGDFLFVRSGAIGRFGIVGTIPKSIFGSYLINFRFDQRIVDNLFFGYFYQSEISLNQIKTITQGGGNININAENIKSLSVDLPPIEEQRAIANNLSDIDFEIENLEKKLEKYNQIKQGAMQVLLTGKIRLIKN